jgi:hypothetical protein
MLLRNKFSGFLADGTRTPFMGGGGGGGTTQSTGTTYTTNLPEYAQPYVETMLGATQKQLFQTQPGADGVTEITGFQPYTPYSTDPTKYVAGFSPLQQQAQQTVAGMQTPGAYGQAQGMAGMSGMGQFGTAQQAGILGGMGTGLGMSGVSAAAPAFGAGQQFMQGITNPANMAAYMSPYQQAVTDVAKSNAVREAQLAGQQANLGAARQGTYGGARQALAGAERERNLLANLSNIQAQGSQSAYDRALAQQQFGANLGLQGIQTGLQGIQTGMQGVGQGLQGVGAQQAGYAGAGQAASTLGALAGQEFGTQKDIVGLQTQAGAAQQAQQQQIINQAIQDYANAQQYPMMQLGFMSNMLRGLPMQSTSTQQYVAGPNQLTQGIGALGAGANIYSAFSGNTAKAAGGEIKSYARGGIASYSAGDRVKSDLSAIRSADELEEIARNTTSDTIRREALRLAKMREMGLAGGGIVAFADGKTVYGQSNKTREDYELKDSDELKARREADIAAALALKAERDATPPVVEETSVAPAAAATSSGIAQVAPSGGRFSTQGAGTPRVDLSKLKSATDVSSGRSAADVRAGRGIPSAVKQDVKDSVLKTVAESEIDASGRNSLGETKAEQANMAVKKDEAPAASARENTGIKAAAKKDEATPAVVPSSDGISSGRANIRGLSPTMQDLYDRAATRQQTLAEILEEQKAAKEKYVGPDTRPEERARLMAEKSNLAEEARRQEKLQIAQFFASWGSTPGSTLQAAMVAVNKNIPNIIASQKDARKAQNEVDKIIRELNKAERLEKEGDFDAAVKIKTEQAKKYEDLNKTLMTYVGQKEAAAVKATGTDKVQQEKLLLTAQRDLGAARRALTDLRSKNKPLYDRAALPGEGKDIDAMRNKAKSEIAALEAQHLAQIEEAEATLAALRKHGDIVVPGREKKTTEVASNTTVKKYNRETGRIE